MQISNEIGSFEAKTRLSELLRETESGAAFVITRRGKAVARLVPYREEASSQDDWREGFARIREEVGCVSTAAERRQWINEGRR